MPTHMAITTSARPYDTRMDDALTANGYSEDAHRPIEGADVKIEYLVRRGGVATGALMLDLALGTSVPIPLRAALVTP